MGGDRTTSTTLLGYYYFYCPRRRRRLGLWVRADDIDGIGSSYDPLC